MCPNGVAGRGLARGTRCDVVWASRRPKDSGSLGARSTALRDEVLHEAHDAMSSGHLGARKIVACRGVNNVEVEDMSPFGRFKF